MERNHEVHVWPEAEAHQDGALPRTEHFFWTRWGAERFARRLVEQADRAAGPRPLVRVVRRDPLRRPCDHANDNDNECVADGCWGTVPRT